MREKDIDSLVEKIDEDKTREYFSEVISSFYGGNYRSAMVMLYSVTITDVLLKLRKLKEIYDDESATNILEKIEELQTANPNSPEWERKLIELTRTQTKVLDSSAFAHLLAVQNLRHLSAHPVLSDSYELFQPSKDEVKAQIGNILREVLTKPPLLSKDVFTGIVESLAENQDILIKDEALEKFLTSKYLNNISLPVESQVFRSLWIVTFKLDNLECNENRGINFRAVRFFMKRNYETLINSMETEVGYYSQIFDETIELLIKLINLYPKIFQILNEAAQLQIEGKIKKLRGLNFISFFQAENLEAHLEYIFSDEFHNAEFEESYIETERVRYLFDIVKENLNKERAADILVFVFVNSGSFYNADHRYEEIIKPNLSLLTEQQFIELFEGMNNNSQIHSRRAAKASNTFIMRAAKKKYSTIEFAQYGNLSHYVIEESE